MISLSRKAGKLIAGFDTVKQAAGERKAAAVLTAADVSAKTLKEVVYFCEKYEVPHLKLMESMAELAQVTGRKAGVLALTDPNFAERIAIMAAASNKEE